MKTSGLNEKSCLCALNRIFGFEPKIGIALIERLGSAEAVFGLDGKSLSEFLGPCSKYLDMVRAEEVPRSRDELERLARDGCRFVGIGEEGYPSLLRECEDPPIGLYYKSVSSPEEIFNSRPCIAIVGTRDFSPYGREWTWRIASTIARSQRRPAIVSGLAYGVDFTAHMAALENGTPTIAVMATGIEEIYPYRHAALAERIASSPGSAIVTDYPPGTGAAKVNFLRRNRIIAGLSKATVLTESKTRGGGMITARLAFSYGREVFALPGRVDDIRSQGCLNLIREKVAEPVGSPEGLVEALGLGTPSRLKRRDFLETVEEYYKGTVDGKVLKDILSVASTVYRIRGVSIDEICRSTGLQYGSVASLTGMMEGDGLIKTDLLQRCFVGPMA